MALFMWSQALDVIRWCYDFLPAAYDSLFPTSVPKTKQTLNTANQFIQVLIQELLWNLCNQEHSRPPDLSLIQIYTIVPEGTGNMH